MVLLRLAIRHSLPRLRPRIPSLRVVNRSPGSLRYRQFRHFSSQPTPASTKQQQPVSGDPKGGPQSATVPTGDVTVQEQRKKDWNIMRKMMEHMWPRDWSVRCRVVLGFGLLVGGKVNRALLP